MGRPVFAVVFAIGGCTLLVDTSDLANGVPDAPVERPGPLLEGGTPGPDARADAPDVAFMLTCPEPSYVCDDFGLGIGKWTPHLGNQGGIELASDIVHSPKHAFHASSMQDEVAGGSENVGELRIPIAPAKKGGLLVFHAWIYLPAPLQGDTGIVKFRASSGEYDMNLKLDSDGHYKIDSDVPNDGPELSASDPAPLGKWTCVEWEASLGTPGQQTLFVDGKKVIDAVENNVPSPGYGSVGIGFLGNPATKPMSIYFDDVIVGETPVPCP